VGQKEFGNFVIKDNTTLQQGQEASWAVSRQVVVFSSWDASSPMLCL
jgi:hypothetical protein